MKIFIKTRPKALSRIWFVLTVAGVLTSLIFLLFDPEGWLGKIVGIVGVLSAAGIAGWIEGKHSEIIRIDEDKPTFVTDLLVRKQIVQAAFAVILLLLPLAKGIYSQDYVSIGIVIASATVIGAFTWLTKLRTKRGVFADNPFEVLELISFIIASGKSGGLPPGLRLSRRHSEATQRVRSPQEAVGSPAS
ncbi:hypothetical protein I6F35_10035 [Bradyrhizobium sp. BRP22]|uniref:hypothetical protein n=1 Tax=Bradyrhizobium sp. BRP22 TaxID=2793821 RepID=UPI001CD42477|nr:hypothetical protein [Bradyrhizobium sp. BRP22]MCA1453552.1 hypothetical protein [Bradyrhizobium sp. BRP22]